MTELYDILDCSDKGIAKFIQIVKKGGVVLFPTDTVYGIGCDPYNSSAVKRIFEIKGRQARKSLPVLVGSIGDAESIVSLGPKGRFLAERFWPGALTIVAPLKDKNIASDVTAGKDSLAVRMPANKCICDVLKIFKYLVGTSANRSGKNSTSDVQQVLQSLSGFDAILIAETSLGGRESTVIDVSGPNPTILREGAIGVHELEKVL